MATLALLLLMLLRGGHHRACRSRKALVADAPTGSSDCTPERAKGVSRNIWRMRTQHMPKECGSGGGGLPSTYSIEPQPAAPSRCIAKGAAAAASSARVAGQYLTRRGGWRAIQRHG